MSVLDHVSIAVLDFATARPFYDAVMTALEVKKVSDLDDALGYGTRCNADEDFHTCIAVYLSPDANTNDKRHWCFKAKSRQQVRDFYNAGLKHGGLDDGPRACARITTPITTAHSSSIHQAIASKQYVIAQSKAFN